MNYREMLRRNAEQKQVLARQQIDNQQARLATAGGFDGRGGDDPPNRQRTRDGGCGPRLTPTFNQAAKMSDVVDLPRNDPRVKKLMQQMREAANEISKQQGNGINETPNRPVSKLVAEQLEKQRSQMRQTHEMSPLGTIHNTFDPQKERVISHEIKRINERLDKHHGMAMDEFNKEMRKGFEQGL